MFSDVFLAMSGSEIQRLQPAKAAYMACHFSASGQGLSNLPGQLPEKCLLLLDDSTPIAEHDPQTVVAQLNALVDALSPKALLLDFQRDHSDDSMIAAILKNARCPVAVSKRHCVGLDCPVFLPPLPANKLLAPYLTPFLRRGVYLEIAPEAVQVTVTADGSKTVSIPLPDYDLPLEHKELCCHYDVQVNAGKAIFTIQRTGKDLEALTRQAYSLGVDGVVGLYQELGTL